MCSRRSNCFDSSIFTRDFDVVGVTDFLLSFLRARTFYNVPVLLVSWFRCVYYGNCVTRCMANNLALVADRGRRGGRGALIDVCVATISLAVAIDPFPTVSSSVFSRR